MSLVYTSDKPRGKRFHVNVAGAAMLADIHRLVGLPLSGDEEDISMSDADRQIFRKSRLLSVRVPYKATRAQAYAWGVKLMSFRRLDTEDLESLRLEWQRFLIRCDGYVAE
jgi:hypothetical protein